MVVSIGPSPRGTFWCKVFGGNGLSLDFPLLDFAVKDEGPAFGRALLLNFQRRSFLFSIYI
jgi:hypothetical protein